MLNNREEKTEAYSKPGATNMKFATILATATIFAMEDPFIRDEMNRGKGLMEATDTVYGSFINDIVKKNNK